MAVTIETGAVINCDDFQAGDGTIIRAGAQIYGSTVHLGRECFIDQHAVIGGGSASDGSFHAGDWLHLGMYSQINTARPVTIGTEVGIGIGTRIFTHGAYLSELDGFPVSFDEVTIGSHVWLPNAQVNPGSNIGSDVVIAAGSVVSGDIPSGCLAGGIPARVIRSQCYPHPVNRYDVLTRIAAECGAWVDPDTDVICDTTTFHCVSRTIEGPATERTEQVKNQLRRHGIRFPYTAIDGEYVPWTS